MNLNNANKRCKNYLKIEGYFDPCHNWAHTGILVEKAQLRLTFDINQRQWIAGRVELTQDGEASYIPEGMSKQDKVPNIAVVKAFLAYLDSKRPPATNKDFNSYNDKEYSGY